MLLRRHHQALQPTSLPRPPWAVNRVAHGSGAAAAGQGTWQRAGLLQSMVATKEPKCCHCANLKSGIDDDVASTSVATEYVAVKCELVIVAASIVPVKMLPVCCRNCVATLDVKLER